MKGWPAETEGELLCMGQLPVVAVALLHDSMPLSAAQAYHADSNVY